MSNAIIGFDELTKKLNKLVDNQTIINALTVACVRVENEAKINAPVDDGTLRMSITHSIDNVKMQGIVGTNVEYAPYVEFGTGIFAAGGDGRKTPWRYRDVDGTWHFTRGQKPQPFLLPALDNNRKKIVEDIKKAVEAHMKGMSK